MDRSESGSGFCSEAVTERACRLVFSQHFVQLLCHRLHHFLIKIGIVEELLIRVEVFGIALCGDTFELVGEEAFLEHFGIVVLCVAFEFFQIAVSHKALQYTLHDIEIRYLYFAAEALVDLVDDTLQRILFAHLFDRIALGRNDVGRLLFEYDCAREGLFELGILQLDHVVYIDIRSDIPRQRIDKMRSEKIFFEQSLVVQSRQLGYVRIGVVESAYKVAHFVLLVLFEIDKSLLDRLQQGAESAERGRVLFLARLRAHKVVKSLDVLGIVEQKRLYLVSEIVHSVEVRSAFEQRSAVKGLESLFDLFVGVFKVEHQRAFFAGTSTVEARERLYGVDSFEFFVDVHGMQKRLVKARLILVGNNHNVEVGAAERLAKFLVRVDKMTFRVDIESRLGILFAVKSDHARKCDEHVGALGRLRIFLQIFFDGEVISDGVDARIRHDHGFAFAAYLEAAVFEEVCHDDFGFFAYRMTVLFIIFDKRSERGAFKQFGVFLGRLRYSERLLYRCIIGEHVEYKAFFDRLSHRIDVERLHLGSAFFVDLRRTRRPEQLQRLWLGRGGKGKKRLIGVFALGNDLVDSFVSDVDFVLVDAFFVGIIGYGKTHVYQCSSERFGTLSALSLVGFVDDDGEFPALHAVKILVCDQEFLYRADNDTLFVVDGGSKSAGALFVVYRLDKPVCMFKAVDRVLQLGVEHNAVGDNYDRIENRLVLVVVQRREAIGGPRDRVRLAAACRMFDEITAPDAVFLYVGYQPFDHVVLMKARENDLCLFDFSRDAVFDDLVFFFDVGYKPVTEIEQRLPFKHSFPKIRSRVAVGVGGIALAAVDARAVGTLVERHKIGCAVFELSGHPRFVVIESKIDQKAVIGSETEFFAVAVRLVLHDSVFVILSGELAFEFERDNGYAVERQHHVYRVVIFVRIRELPRATEDVALIAVDKLLVERRLGLEIAYFEFYAEIFDAVAQSVQKPVFADCLFEPRIELFGRIVPIIVSIFCPCLGLGLLDKRHQHVKVYGALCVIAVLVNPLAAVVLPGELLISPVSYQRIFYVRFKLFFSCYHRELPPWVFPLLFA